MTNWQSGEDSVRYRVPLFIFCFILLFRRVSAYEKSTPGLWIGYSCDSALLATWCSVYPPESEDNPYQWCECENINSQGSFIYCGFQESKTEEIKSQFEDYMISMCPALTREKMQETYENVTKYLVNTTDLEDFNQTNPIDYPIYYDETLFEEYYVTNKDWYGNLERGVSWGSGLLGFWAFIVLLGGIDHWTSRFLPNYSLSVKRLFSQTTPIRWFRKNVSLPALFNGKHTAGNLFGGLLPTRFESVVLSIFFALVVLSESTNIHYMPNDQYWPDKRGLLSRYVGDRSGVIACFLMVPTYLFAGRNNILLWITGWKQSTFFTFHKWLARMLVFTVFVHTITMFMNYHWYDYIYLVKTESWWRWGSVAMVAGATALFQSMSFLRVKYYEVFLYFHIILVLFFLIGAWIHLVTFEYGEWAYASASVWCFDRLIRLGRMATFGIKTAKVTLISDEILLVSMNHGFRAWKPKPGSFGYVYFCNSWLFFQSHAFTVLDDGDGRIKFLVKIKNGITRRLYEKISQAPDHEFEIKVSVEGMYGEYKPAFSYDEVILVAGGNGIPGLYEYIGDIAQMKSKDKSNTKFIKLYWVIRHWHSLDWFVDEISKLQKYDFVQTVVYVTKFHDAKLGRIFSDNGSISFSDVTPEYTVQGDEKKGEEAAAETISREDLPWFENICKKLPHVIFKEGRPDMAHLIHEDIREAGSQSNIAVLTCAHNIMCDDVRRAVAQESGEPRIGRVDLFELLQAW